MGLLCWESLVAYSFHYYNEQEVKLIVKYSTRVMRQEAVIMSECDFSNVTLKAVSEHTL